MSVLSPSSELPQHHVCEEEEEEEEEEEVASAHSSSNQESTSSLKPKAPEVKEEEPEPAQVKEEELQPPQIKEEAAETKTEEPFGNFNIVSIKKEEEETDGQLLETSEPQRSSHTAVSTSMTLNPLQEAEEYIRLGSDKDVLTWRFADHIRGRGVFAKGPISKGSFILEYRGNLFKKGDSGTTINEHTYVFTHKGDDYCIDASSEDGSPGTLVNYHHQPNTSMTKVDVDGVPHLCLFAVVGINEGEEITRDYGAVGVHSSEMVDPTTVQNSGESPAAASQQEFLGDSQVEGTSRACVSSEEGRRRKRNEGTAGMKRRKMDCLTHDDIKVEKSSFERRSDCLGPSSSLKWAGLEHKAEEEHGRAPTLRTQCSKLLKSKPSGNGEKAMTALVATETGLPTSMKNTLAIDELPCSDEDEESKKSEDSEHLPRSSSLSSTPLTSHAPRPPNTTKNREEIPSTEAVELEKIKILQQISRTFQNGSRPAADADTTFGVQVTSELKLITDPKLKTRVKRQIMMALYEAQESVSSTPIPPSQY